MPSFFEKLKKGVGIEHLEEYEKTEEPASQTNGIDTAEEQKPKKSSALKAVTPDPEEKTPAVQASKGKKKKKVEVRDTESEEETSPAKSEEDQEGQEWFVAEGELAADVYQTDGEIVIQSTIAGVRPEELEISIEEDIVTIFGERKNPHEAEEKKYFYQECYWGPFSRQIILPQPVDIERAEATMKNGILTLRLPKVDERVKMKKIKIKS